MPMFSSTRCLILALALPALGACGDTTEAPAPEAAPEAPAWRPGLRQIDGGAA